MVRCDHLLHSRRSVRDHRGHLHLAVDVSNDDKRMIFTLSCIGVLIVLIGAALSIITGDWTFLAVFVFGIAGATALLAGLTGISKLAEKLWP